jgi:hypothetical protein
LSSTTGGDGSSANTYASVVDSGFSDESQKKNLSWADMLDLEDDEPLVPLRSTEEKLREMFDSGTSDAAVLPFNLDMLPRLNAYFQSAVNALKFSVVIERNLDAANLVAPKFWSCDEKEVHEELISLEASNAELLEHLKLLSGYFAGMLNIPSKRTLGATSYGWGQRAIGSMAVLAYQESRYHNRMADIRPMLTGYSQARDKLNKAVDAYGLTGGAVLKRLVSLTESIVKRYIRQLVSGQLRPEKRDAVLEQLEQLSVCLMAPPKSTLDLHCRIVKEEKIVRKGRTSEKVSRIRVLRPAIASEGVPILPEEAAIAKQINVAIGHDLPRALARVRIAGNLAIVRSQVKASLDYVYSRVDPLNALIKERKRQVRNAIIAKRLSEEAKTSPDASIGPHEWEMVQSAMMSTFDSSAFMRECGSLFSCPPDADSIRTAISSHTLEKVLEGVLSSFE